MDGDDDVEDDEPSGGQFARVERRTQASRDMTYVWSGRQDAEDDAVEVDFYSQRLALVAHFD